MKIEIEDDHLCWVLLAIVAVIAMLCLKGCATSLTDQQRDYTVATNTIAIMKKQK